MHTDPLLGTGFESFWTGRRLERVWEMTMKGLSVAHNGYIEIYLNLGFTGIALLGWAIIAGYRRATNLLRSDPQAGRLRMAIISAGVIYGVSEDGFRMLSPIWIALLLGLVVMPSAVGARRGPNGAGSAPCPRPARLQF